MTPSEDFALEERIAKAIREECLNIFGSTWNYDVAHRLARAAIQAMPAAGALPNGDR